MFTTLLSEYDPLQFIMVSALTSWFQEYNWNEETRVSNKSNQQQCGFIAML